MNKPIEKPILFSGPMVRAILDGTKTMTRRVVKIPYEKGNSLGTWEPSILGGKGCTDNNGNFVDEFPVLWHTRTGYSLSCPYGQVGDRLWVRETWRRAKGDLPDGIEYRADNLLVWFDGNEPQKAREDIQRFPRDGKWRPSIFMPRWASRITLEVAGVRIERLQEISNEDIRKEGVAVLGCVTHRLNFEQLWDSINGKTYPWASNPFVWVIEFRRIDAL